MICPPRFPVFNLFIGIVASTLFAASAAATFASDHTVYQIHSFYFAWGTIMLCRIVLRIRIKKIEANTQAFLFTLFIPLLFTATDGLHQYHHGYVFAILYVNVFSCFFFLIARKEIFYISLIALLFFAAQSLASIADGQMRATIIFGPNVLYRIAIFFGAFFLASFSMVRPWGNAYTKNIVALLFLFAAVSSIILATGSRGGLLTFLFSIVLVVFFHKNSFHGISGVRALAVFLMTAGAALLFLFLDKFLSRFWRLFHYSNLESGALRVRLEFFEKGEQFLLDEKSVSLIFGHGPQNTYFSIYPHNIFLEALITGGMLQLFFVLLLFVVVLIALAFPKDRPLKLAVSPLAGILIGSVFSGGIQYNFPIISAGATLALIFFRFVNYRVCIPVKGGLGSR